MVKRVPCGIVFATEPRSPRTWTPAREGIRLPANRLSLRLLQPHVSLSNTAHSRHSGNENLRPSTSRSTEVTSNFLSAKEDFLVSLSRMVRGMSPFADITARRGGPTVLGGFEFAHEVIQLQAGAEDLPFAPVRGRRLDPVLARCAWLVAGSHLCPARP